MSIVAFYQLPVTRKCCLLVQKRFFGQWAHKVDFKGTDNAKKSIFITDKDTIPCGIAHKTALP